MSEEEVTFRIMGQNCVWFSIGYVHRLQTPNEAFFHCNPELLGLERQNGQINSGAFGYFRPHYQHPFWYSESLVHVFHYSTIISTKKLSLYIHIPNIYLVLGFEFGMQRIRDLAFVCP
jgi:hypothetical protein